MFISCRTSPSAITLVASASTSSTRMLVGADHHLEGARIDEVADQHARRRCRTARWRCRRPRRSADSSTTSSCSSVAVWMNSTVAASSKRSRPAEPSAFGEQQHEHRPDPLAAGADDVVGDLVDQRHIEGQPAPDRRRRPPSISSAISAAAPTEDGGGRRNRGGHGWGAGRFDYRKPGAPPVPS